MKELGEVTFTIILMALLAPFGGLVLSYLWDWFIMPVFDFRSISIVLQEYKSFESAYKVALDMQEIKPLCYE